MIVSTKTFDNLDLDKLDEELNTLGFASDYCFCDDGLLELTIVSIEGQAKAHDPFLSSNRIGNIKRGS